MKLLSLPLSMHPYLCWHYSSSSCAATSSSLNHHKHKKTVLAGDTFFLQRLYNGVATALFKVETFTLITTHTPLIRLQRFPTELPHLLRRYRRHVHHCMWFQHSAPDLQYLRNFIALLCSSYTSRTFHPMSTLSNRGNLPRQTLYPVLRSRT